MTTTREESEMETRAPDRSKCKPWCGEKNSELYCHAVESVFNGGAFADFGNPAFDETRWCTLACLDGRLPPIQPPEPETWRGMRVGQRLDNHWGTIRLITRATPNEIDTRTEGSNLVQHWRRSHPGDRSSVESWTLVSDAGEAVTPALAPCTCAEKASYHIGCPGPTAVPAKAEPAKVLECALYNKSRHAGQVLMRSFGSAPVPACEACYMENERYAATGTPFTEPEKAPAAKPPRYPESNDIDADIPDSWAR